MFVSHCRTELRPLRAGETFSDEVRTRIESVSADIKLDSAELLGLTRETVKEAVKQAIKAGNDALQKGKYN